MKKRVIIESPFGTRPDCTRASAEEVARNLAYARRAQLDSLRRGEAPFGSHLCYPQSLDDATPEEREMGISAGFAWGEAADLVAVYQDHGLTPGMVRGVERATAAGQAIEYRNIGEEPEPPPTAKGISARALRGELDLREAHRMIAGNGGAGG